MAIIYPRHFCRIQALLALPRAEMKLHCLPGAYTRIMWRAIGAKAQPLRNGGFHQTHLMYLLFGIPMSINTPCHIPKGNQDSIYRFCVMPIFYSCRPKCYII